MRRALPAATALTLLAAAAAPLGAQGPSHVCPARAVERPGTSSNLIPFAWTPIHYQQVVDRDAFSRSAPKAFTSLSLRAAPVATARIGETIEVEMHLARSPHGAASARPVFAGNVVPGSEVNVFARKRFTLPQDPLALWAVTFPFDTPFQFSGADHLSLRVVVWGNSHNNASFPYPLEAWDRAGTVEYFGGQGRHDLASWHAILFASVGGPGEALQFRIYSYLPPSMRIPALAVVGTNERRWGSLELPFHLWPLGALHSYIYVDWVLVFPGMTDGLGSNIAFIDRTVPADPALVGARFLAQGWLVDPAANALGLVGTRAVEAHLGGPPGMSRVFASGDPRAASGVVTRDYGLTLGFH